MTDCKSTCESLAGHRETITGMVEQIELALSEARQIESWDEQRKERIVAALEAAKLEAEGEIGEGEGR